MAQLNHPALLFLLQVALPLYLAATAASAAPIMQLVEITGGHPIVGKGGNTIDLVLDQSSASGFQSKQQFLFARLDMKIKLPANDSAGTVTTFYMSSQGAAHDEIDLEFLGNVSGQPIVLHTNIYAQGKGDKEMQFYLWFDPRAQYHTYSILWNPQFIIIYVDGKPIRAFPNLSGMGIPFPTSQNMRMYASIWNADDWATQGGRVKTNWSHAPFLASYTSFQATSCPATSKNSRCMISRSRSGKVPQLDNATRSTIQSLQKKYMIYNYCADKARFPQGLPPECSVKF
ncbi:xyloglucan endotransglucosylase protein 7-like [Nymphaea colorata]|nr:xyloglucan endotransglucosylase protein 7-like [Nymphaea colorata]